MKNVKLNTFSIVGFDPKTGELGVAVASKFLAAAALVPFAKAGVGAIATQSWVNLEYGTMGLELLVDGLSPEEVLKKLTDEDEGSSVRQVGIVDASGRSATYTGTECHSWAGGIAGQNFAAQGNILVDEDVVKKMADAFQTSEGDLADRLLAALLAGDEAGGDSRGKQSAGLLVVKQGGSYGGYTDKYIDLRVDDHEDPVQELIRIHELHKLYFKKSSPEDILATEEELKDQLVGFLTALGYLKGDAPATEDTFNEALKSFHLIENFDERIQEPGQIDRKVVEFMESLVRKRG